MLFSVASLSYMKFVLPQNNQSNSVEGTVSIQTEKQIPFRKYQIVINMIIKKVKRIPALKTFRTVNLPKFCVVHPGAVFCSVSSKL